MGSETGPWIPPLEATRARVGGGPCASIKQVVNAVHGREVAELVSIWASRDRVLTLESGERKVIMGENDKDVFMFWTLSEHLVDLCNARYG